MKIEVSYDRRQPFDAGYTFVDTPYGEAVAVFTHKGLCYLGFTRNDRACVLRHVADTFPNMRLAECERTVDPLSDDVVLHLIGTPFRVDVWRALIGVERGRTVSYSELARRAGHPRAVRAAASAVACNPVSLLVPCHRIVRSDGSVGEYYWGSAMKCRILRDEGALR
ncbi:bifunctional transcriptional activator/DNA repair enzyme Ada [Alistipes sp.]|nr:bifunctional transcriptional activator/DNA repair enzyme Ada [Alistipes sp.]